MTYDVLLKTLANHPVDHMPGTSLHSEWQQAAMELARTQFGADSQQVGELGPLGQLKFPYWQMGAISSVDLLQVDELMLFVYYWLNRKRYRNVADVGANIGLHSVILDRCGYTVRAYEPDPKHVQILRQNLEINQCESVEVIEKAVSSSKGKIEFVRVRGNTTGSHVAGAKENPYGELDRFEVETESFGDVMSWADLVKLDAEGHERDIILSVTGDTWQDTDVFVEIGGEENARDIFEYAQSVEVNMFTQKLGWKRAESIKDVPKHYSEGMAFLSGKNAMLWEEES